MTPGEVGKCLSLLKAAYPRQEVHEETFALYSQFLGDMDFDAAQRAVLEHIATSPFFPAVSELRKLAAKASLDVPAAEEAWHEVLEAVRWYGRYRMPVWSSGVIRAAVANVGWEAICNSENIGVERAHFLRCYTAIHEKALTEANVGPLLAAHEERQAARLGRPVKAGEVLELDAGKDDGGDGGYDA